MMRKGEERGGEERSDLCGDVLRHRQLFLVTISMALLSGLVFLQAPDRV